MPRQLRSAKKALAARALRSAAFVGVALAGPCRPAFAEGDAGVRVFPVTLVIDDVDVTDEATLPLLTWQREADEDGRGPADAYAIGAEFSKRITERLGVGVADSLSVRSAARGGTRAGSGDVSLSLKYQAYVSPAHEFLVSLGVVRAFGRTGAAPLGAEGSGFTAPAIYAGKGFPEAANPLLRPFAVTGTLSYAFSDRGLKQHADAFNDGAASRLAGGVSVQYSLPYLSEQVGRALPTFVAHLVPLVEVAWSTPASRPSALGTQTVVAPGVIYSSGDFQVGVEALIPANAASGAHVGVAAQLHLFFEGIFPDSLGKPLLDF